MNRPNTGSQPIPASVLGMAASRRNVLRGGLLGGALLGSSTFLAACGGDSGGGGDASAAVKFGMNEASGAGPAYDRLAQMAKAYATKSGVTVERNEVDHNTFQENINTYLQGNPDDVFTWFAGFRMNQFAEQGLITDVSDVWPIDGIADSFKTAATATDGKQYFVPKDYYPWAVFYKKSVFEKNGYVPPTNLDELTTLTKKMQVERHHAVRLRRQGRLAGDGHLRHPQHAHQRLRLPHEPHGRGRGVGLHRGQAGVRHLGRPVARTTRRTRSAAPGRRRRPR